MAENTLPFSRLTYIKAVAIFTLASFGVAIILLATNGWFGAGDLISFAMWTILWSLPLSALVALYVRWSTKWSQPIRYAVASFLGLLIGYLLTILLEIILGLWFATFSFPVLYCWLFGSLLSFLLPISGPSWKSWGIGFGLALILSVGSVVGLQQLTPG
jgi:hypothetical protein